MAIDGVVKSGTESNWGFIEGAVFSGDANPEQASYEIVEGPIPSIDYGVTQIQDVRHGRGRGYDINDGYITQKGGTRVISFSDWIVRGKELGPLLYAVCQVMDEGEATAFQKDIDITNTTTQPDFNANAGYFCNILIDNVLAGKDQIFEGCILRTLTLSANSSAGDGRLRAAGEFISGFNLLNNQTFATGTPAFNTQTYYEFNCPTAKTVAGADVILSDWSLTITNNAARVGSTSAGECETYSLGTYEVTGSITLKWDTASDAHLTSWLAGTAEAISLRVGTASNAGYFDISIPKAEYTGNERSYENELGQMVTLPFKAGFNGSSNDMINLQVDDENDRSWPT